MIDSLVEADLKRIHGDASAQWTALVENGISPDSATEFALTDIRARFTGRSRPQASMPFLTNVDLESAWKARMLSPFHKSELTLPRGEGEATFLMETRIDLRNALAAGRPTLRIAHESESSRRVSAALALLAIVAAIVARRVSKRRSAEAATAL